MPVARLLEANFGRSARVTIVATRPLFWNIMMDFASGPQVSTLVPSARVVMFETCTQSPTSCSLRTLLLSACAFR